MKSLRCLLGFHAWAKLSGFNGYPAYGTTCMRCGARTETLAEFLKRNGRGV